MRLCHTFMPGVAWSCGILTLLTRPCLPSSPPFLFPPFSPQARKSVGAEVNWGVRFDSDTDARSFLRELCGEVEQRLQQGQGGGAKGRTLTVKVCMEVLPLTGTSRCSLFPMMALSSII